jgi:hypothetical protein
VRYLTILFLSTPIVGGCLPSGGVDWQQVKSALDAMPQVCYRDNEREVCVSKHETTTDPPVVMGGPDKEECSP